MKEQDAKQRITNFNEVNLGYSNEEAITEASRCLNCKAPNCVKGCPVNINIPKFIKQIKEQDVQQAIKTIKESNNLPGVCGRVCPQEELCEKNCIIKKNPIKIGYLERFAADNEATKKAEIIARNNKKVAVIGSGPASLTAAADLAIIGYEVTLFEALHKTGGVLRYGIPEFRLPKSIVEKEIEHIESLGVNIRKNFIIGKTLSLEDLKKDFNAIFIGVGAGLPYFLNIEGENMPGVFSANEFLTRANLMFAFDETKSRTPIKKGRNTVVVGGGNVAIDAARVAKRLGSDVTIVYRRTFEEMPARIEEIEHAKEEGINFMLLANPTKIIGTANIEGIECVKMVLSEMDSSGRRKPVQEKGSEFVINCDQVIVAIGQGPNPLLLKDSNLKKEQGYLVVNESLQTSDKMIFAGGDIIGGNATVIKAMADGKIVAKSINAFLS